MKTKISILIVLLSGMFTAQAQKFAYVDTDYILKNIPSYNAAQEELDELSEKWQQEVEAARTEVEEMYKDYQAEAVLLTDEMKQKREEAIMQKEQQVKELQQKYFGREGMLYQKRQELISPIQDEVYNAVKEIATEGGFSIILDTSPGVNVLYSDPKFDRSDQVLEKLGYKN
ncbi:MAG: OmpH family outer membrane protein [Bacteroidales bacterium]